MGTTLPAIRRATQRASPDRDEIASHAIGRVRRDPRCIVQRWALLQKHRLQTAHAQLQAMNPRGVLERGYSWIQDAQGRALTRIEQFQAGMAVQAVLADGEVHLTVDAPKAQG